MDILTNILDVFESVGQWIAGAFENLMPIFYTPGVSGASGSLTVIGVLAVSGLSISVCMMLFNLIRSFLRFE